VGFVDDQDGGELSLGDAVEDLHKESVFAAFWGFPKVGDKKAQQSDGIDSGEMEINGVVAVFGEFLDKEPKECRFADASLAGEERERALLSEVFEPGHGLFEAVVIEDPVKWGRFLEGMIRHFEVIQEHGVTPVPGGFV
jgi:hypothetical protein